MMLRSARVTTRGCPIGRHPWLTTVSTLAPLFAAAFATHNTWSTFLVGLAAAIGAGISMAFAEALSDDGSLTGRGAPVVRGSVTGAMTAIGGLGHALPYLIPNFFVATTVAFIVVAIAIFVSLVFVALGAVRCRAPTTIRVATISEIDCAKRARVAIVVAHDVPGLQGAVPSASSTT